jgi:hypothetical protein
MVIPCISYDRSEIWYLLRGVRIGVIIGELVFTLFWKYPAYSEGIYECTYLLIAR